MKDKNILLFCCEGFTSICIIPARSVDVPQWFIVQEDATDCDQVCCEFKASALLLKTYMYRLKHSWYMHNLRAHSLYLLDASKEVRE